MWSKNLNAIGARFMERISYFGLALITFGIPLAVFSFLIFSRAGITAFGLVCAILGGTLLLVPWNPLPEPPLKSMVEASCINVEALLEEADAKGKAIYLPPRNGRVYAFAPLKSDPKSLNFNQITDTPFRIIMNVAGVPGLVIFPPGSEIIRSSNLDQEMGLEVALEHVMVDFIEAVESVRATRKDGEIRVHLSGPNIDTDQPRFKKVLGTLPTTMVGSVISYTLDAPVQFVGENSTENEIEAVFEVMSEDG